MSDPRRLAAQKAVAELIAAARVEDGYTYSLEGVVFRGRATFGDDDPLPMVSILEPPEPSDSLATSNPKPVAAGTYDLLIQGFVENDETNPTDPGHILAANVRRALAIERKKGDTTQLSGLAKIQTIGSPVVRPPDETSAKAYFWMRLSLSIVEDLENPFA